ncbi:MAG: ABC transporter permease [Deltaproteobacteria bacterium]|nr:ABC transporter permease [Candidatus Anaeroferrophillus wilburensis]MBN2890197.1 ABC transporter permease [Deltaproteobacteria bacterium]
MLTNTLLLALREIRRNVLRSFLTILGIVIGVAAVIVMVTIGAGATAQVTEQIASLGSNLLMIRVGQHMGAGQTSAAPPFDLADVQALYREIPAITAVAPSSSQKITAVYSNANWSTTVSGVDNQFFAVRNWTIETGRQFLDTELRSGKAVCVIGATVAKELFGRQAPLDNKIRLGSFSCQIIGVLEAKGQSTFGSDQDDLVLVPLRTFQRRIAGNQDIGLIQVSVAEGRSTDKAKSDIEYLLRERRHVSGSENDNFQVRDMKEITRMLTGTTQILTSLLGAVAAVSLLVGGIGIMNIMLVSVTERTREIGIRLAIGALEREVLLQFLVEAVVLSSFGGIIGIVLALSTSIGLASLLNIPFVFNLGIMVIAFLFSAAVGIVFGFFPARKAARLDPIDALRHE